MRGNLILLEGLDRSGKSTQAELLSLRLQASLVKFPDRSTPVGKLINEYLTNLDFHLSDETAHLLFSANRWELASSLEEKLQQGTTVVMDRYVYSGIAYSLAKENLRGREWLSSPDRGLPKPDLTMFLTILMDELALRKNWGQERYEKTAFQQKVRECFMDILRPEEDPTVEIVDVGHLLIEQVTHKLWQLIVQRNLDVPSSQALARLS
ncbi:thymidylate kinase [Metschnikowia bicuspidata var. bicuspidata NRRL YB-4993]|uniref:Thymidylate kinase n=1 Tax=Metschnikowia bicuspidata var. bicuspidata NRRL YB-4993 TaxID=869754 RepID=A0A1A0HAR4_9ASCO|nr:thymidylate kinase [Metschnikowia bicuspidata var. bicuspidata NRRL YB-4993]OBA20972.1 thymidylate kinase [Metschnikowia bicuspidata var. bicuspidata NRRL YB-4993]